MSSPEIAVDPLIGTTVDGRVEIKRLLGKGGMGAVYEGYHMAMNLPVALKVLLGHATRNAEAVKRFQAEARIASGLKHPNVVTTYSFGLLESATPYIVMELVAGFSLEDQLKKHGTLDTEKFATIFDQCCAALAAAHDSGVVHRDIKPSNIVLCEKDGQLVVKITDFGIAKIAGDQNIQSLTRTGEILGTPVYMSPEQCEGKPLDGRSDIYSLGCVMYECLTGEPPFKSDAPLDVMLKHVNEAPESPSERHLHLRKHRPLIDTVMHALEKDPGKRPENMTSLRSELSDAQKGVSNFKRVRRRRWPVRAVLAAASLVCVGTAAYCFLRLPLEPPRQRLADAISVPFTEDRIHRISTIDNAAQLQAFLAPLEGQLARIMTAAESSDVPSEQLTAELRNLAEVEIEIAQRFDQLSHPPQMQWANLQKIAHAQRGLRAREILKRHHLDDGNRYSVSDVAARLARYTYDKNDQWIGFAKTAHAANDYRDVLAQELGRYYYGRLRIREPGGAKEGLESLKVGYALLWGDSRPDHQWIRKELLFNYLLELPRAFALNEQTQQAVGYGQDALAMAGKRQNAAHIQFDLMAELAAWNAQLGNVKAAKDYLERFDHRRQELKNEQRFQKEQKRVLKAVAAGEYARAAIAKSEGNDKLMHESILSAENALQHVKDQDNVMVQYWRSKLSALD